MDTKWGFEKKVKNWVHFWGTGGEPTHKSKPGVMLKILVGKGLSAILFSN